MTLKAISSIIALGSAKRNQTLIVGAARAEREPVPFLLCYKNKHTRGMMVPDPGNSLSGYKHIIRNGSLQKPRSRQAEGNAGTSSCSNFSCVTQQSPGKAHMS